MCGRGDLVFTVFAIITGAEVHGICSLLRFEWGEGHCENLDFFVYNMLVLMRPTLWNHPLCLVLTVHDCCRTLARLESLTYLSRCFLDRGTVFSVGSNVNGQLGLGNQCPTVLTPTRVCSVTTSICNPPLPQLAAYSSGGAVCRA